MKFDDSALLHMKADYDPAVARAYYLRTRKLKGRRRGQEDPTTNRSSSSKTTLTKGSKPSSHLRLVSKGRQAASSERHAQQHAALKKRLGELQNLLRKLIAQAKDKNPPKSKSSKDKEGGKKRDSTPDRKLTTKQKEDAKDRAKKSYEKNKKPAKKRDNDSEDLQADIRAVREKIRSIKRQLKAAAAAGQSQPKSQTARSGR